MRGDSVYERYLRLLAEATALGSVIFTLLALGSMIAEASYVLPAIYIPFTVLFCTLPLALGLLGRWGSVPAIRLIATVNAVIALLFLALWGPATLATPLVGERGPWLLGSLAVAAAAAVIAWPPRVVWPFVAALALGSGVLRYLTLGTHDIVLPLQDVVSVAGFTFFIAGLLMVTLRAGRAQDAALASAVADARSAAEVESRARQRARFGSFVHDDVITTLLAAARAPEASPTIAASAGRALARLDRFVAAGSSGGLSGPDLEVELRSAASEIADGVRFTGSIDAFTGVVPAPVSLAMIGALGEAIRNSVRHGGTPSSTVRCRVDMTATPGSIVIEASDDGRGFDADRIAPERLGIRTSIMARMSAVPGCVARVSSAPGYGTVVVLSWTEGVSS